MRRFRVRALAICAVLTTVLAVSLTALACTTVTVGKDASVDGSVITSHTVDGRYSSKITVIPAQDHEPGAMRPVYNGREFDFLERPTYEATLMVYSPQVPHTYQYFQSCYSFANEHGLIISETTQGGARETTGNVGEAILTIRNLQRIALERCTSAREAVQLMGELAVEYGYFGSCNRGECVNVIDGKEAWIFEIYGAGTLWTKDSGKPGAAWCAVRLPDNHVTANPNYSRFNFDPADPDLPYEVMYSEGYKELAIELGIYDPSEPFIWNQVFGGVDPTRGNDRMWRLYCLLKPSVDWKFEETANYPLSIEPDRKISVYDIMEILRDTHTGTFLDMADAPGWYYEDRNGNLVKSPLATPQYRYMKGWSDIIGVPEAGYLTRNIAVGGCSSYWIGQARDWMPGFLRGVLWYGLDNPENGPFVPLYACATEVPESYHHLNRDAFCRDSAWWAFAQVDFLVNSRYQELKPLLNEELRDPLQTYWLEMQDLIEAKALEIYEAEGEEAAIAFLTTYSNTQLELAERKWWEYADVLMYRLTGGR